jgi:hypothetical protein
MPRDYRGLTPTFDDHIAWIDRFEDADDLFKCEGNKMYYERIQMLYIASMNLYVSYDWILIATDYQLWSILGIEEGTPEYNLIINTKNELYANQNKQSN